MIYSILKKEQLLPLLIFNKELSKVCPHSQLNQNFLCEFNATSSGFFSFLSDQNLDLGFFEHPKPDFYCLFFKEKNIIVEA